MVLCLVTLTDLQTRCAGLSASAELLVHYSVSRGHASFFIYSLKRCLVIRGISLHGLTFAAKTPCHSIQDFSNTYRISSVYS